MERKERMESVDARLLILRDKLERGVRIDTTAPLLLVFAHPNPIHPISVLLVLISAIKLSLYSAISKG
jgi:hypothetical protein